MVGWGFFFFFESFVVWLSGSFLFDFVLGGEGSLAFFSFRLFFHAEVAFVFFLFWGGDGRNRFCFPPFH